MKAHYQQTRTIAPLIPLFLCICRRGSLTAAASELGIGKSMLSKRLTQLENTLQVKLFERSTRKLTLTGAGHKFLKRAEQHQTLLQDAILDIEHWKNIPSGELRITVADILMPDAAAITGRYTSLYPNVEVTIDNQDQRVDLLQHRFDLGLRYGWSENENLVEKCFVEADQQAMVIQRNRLQQKIDSPEDLLSLPWIVPPPEVIDFRHWTLQHPDGRQHKLDYKPSVICSHSAQIYALINAGAGVAIWPKRLLKDDLEHGDIVQLLAEWRMPSPRVFALYPMQKSLSRNARLWLDIADLYFND